MWAGCPADCYSEQPKADQASDATKSRARGTVFTQSAAGPVVQVDHPCPLEGVMDRETGPTQD